MRIYIIGSDGITLCRKAPATPNDGEITAASNEELLAERGLDISYETVRCWVLKFGPAIARRLRRRRPRPSDRWHLDESAPRTHDQQWECGAA